MKKACLFLSVLLLPVLLFCACEPLITHREITSLPEKLIYVQYYDKELDLSGGKITCYFDAGGKSTKGGGTVTDMEGETTIRNNVNFNLPGTYKVYLDYPGNNDEFEIKVIPIEQADWLDETTRKEIREWSSVDTSQDQAAIKNVIDRYFGEMLQIEVEFTEEAVQKRVNNIRPLLDAESAFAEKLPAMLTMDYAYLLHYGYTAFEEFKAESEYKYIYVKGNTAEIGVYENIKLTRGKLNFVSYDKHTITMVKNAGAWHISNDLSTKYRTSEFFDEKAAAGLQPDEIVREYIESLGKKD